MGRAEERESAVKDVLLGLKRGHPCPCTVTDCPFRGVCCLCVRNHLEDGTLPACCLPPLPERGDVRKYPDCRSPALWVLWLAKHPEAVPEGLRGAVRDAVKELAGRIS